MNHVSRIISGIVILVIGLVTLFVSVFQSTDPVGQLWGVGWGLLLLGIAGYLFLNTAEDEIEEIKESEE